MEKRRDGTARLTRVKLKLTTGSRKSQTSIRFLLKRLDYSVASNKERCRAQIELHDRLAHVSRTFVGLNDGSVLFIPDIRQDSIYREFGRCVNYQYRTILTQLYGGGGRVCVLTHYKPDRSCCSWPET